MVVEFVVKIVVKIVVVRKEQVVVREREQVTCLRSSPRMEQKNQSNSSRSHEEGWQETFATLTLLCRHQPNVR